MHELRYDKLPSSFINILYMRSNEGATIGQHDEGNIIIPQNNSKFKFPLLEAARDWNTLPNYYKILSKIK